MKIKMRKEVWTGIVVVLSLGLLYWGLNYLKGIDIFRTETRYLAVYDRVEGLMVSNPVQINGFTVGKVRNINFMPGNSGKVVVEISIMDQKFQLPRTTIAKISSLDLLGSKSINLILGRDINNFHDEGDTLPTSVEASITEEVNNQILPLKMRAEDLLSSMDTVIQVVRAILNKEARENLTASFESIKNAMGTFEIVALRVDTMVYDEKEKLSSIMTNFNSISNNLRNNNESITSILDNVAFITDSIAASNVTQTINDAGVAFKNAAVILEKIERGEGTMGQLVNNDSLYWHLESSSKNLDLLLRDIEEHPGRYVHLSVFGGKSKEERLNEKERKKAAKEKEKLDKQSK